MSASSSSAQQVVYHMAQYQDLLVRSRAAVSARNGPLNKPEPEPGARAGQAEEHRRKRQNIRERMMTQMTDSDKAVLGRQIAAETTTKSTRQRSRMKLKDFRRSAINSSSDSEMHRSIQEMAKSSDSKVSMGTAFGWLARSGDSNRSLSSMARSRDLMCSDDSSGSASSMPRSHAVMTRSRDIMRSGDSTRSASSRPTAVI